MNAKLSAPSLLPRTPRATVMQLLLALSLAPLAFGLAVPATAPVVTIAQGTYSGKTNATSGIRSFLGMPYAQSPVGQLRFALPVAPYNTNNTFVNDASKYGPSCSQQATTTASTGASVNQSLLLETIKAMPFFAPASSESEDCLSINVIAPPASTKLLPVLVWIYGGGFEFGTTSGSDGTPIVQRSMTTGSPIVYVSLNYRLNGFGFMAGREIGDAGVGNLGLQDQRQALRWIQANIAAFGGDPGQVTIWGESAGAISVALQMVHSGSANYENLYRGAFMLSGAPIPAGSVASPNAQKYYDQVVNFVGCQLNVDTLACLRTVPYTRLKAAIDTTPGIFDFQSLQLAWRPRVDGIFLTENPQATVAKGNFSRVPMLNGDCEDEGTFFSVSTNNITTDAQFLAYIKANYAPTATDDEMNTLGNAYPSDVTMGSPYNTSQLNALTPQFKRFASFQGDVVFQAPRRYFFKVAASTQKIWSYVYRRNKDTPFLGSFHSSDLTTQFYASSFAGSADYQFIDYMVNFVTTLDPNQVPSSSIYSTSAAQTAGSTTPVGSVSVSGFTTVTTTSSSNNPNLIYWPQYILSAIPAPSDKQMLTFLDRPSGGLLGLAITFDTYRESAMQVLTAFTLKFGTLT